MSSPIPTLHVSPCPVVSTVAGLGQNGAYDGQGTTASFVKPTGITVDLNGNVYVSDAGASDNSCPSSTIRVISPAGGSKDVLYNLPRC
jgi:hypothetical protein